MEVFGVPGLPEFEPGDDLATAIDERVTLQPEDVVCVASTVVSKVEDRGRSLSSFEPGERAREIADRLGTDGGEEKDPRFAQAVLEEAVELLVEQPFLLARTEYGHVGVNAGIDRSNTGGAELLLLPEDPTASARRIREGLSNSPGVIVTDTSGRPFRLGQRGVAIGWAGLSACRDWRGEPDRDGTKLEVTVEAIVDELAAAANLVSGEGSDGLPVVVVRDFEWGDRGGTDQLFRPDERDYVKAALRDWEYRRENESSER